MMKNKTQAGWINVTTWEKVLVLFVIHFELTRLGLVFENKGTPPCNFNTYVMWNNIFLTISFSAYWKSHLTKSGLFLSGGDITECSFLAQGRIVRSSCILTMVYMRFLSWSFWQKCMVNSLLIQIGLTDFCCYRNDQLFHWTYQIDGNHVNIVSRCESDL